MFGDWHLALASYNWGENSVQRAVERNRGQGRATTYEHLTMPDETQDYIPKLQAIENIVRNHAIYGQILPTLPNRPYFAFTSTGFELKVADAARFAGMSTDEFIALNTAFTNNLIPRQHRIVLPLDRVAAFQRGADEVGRRASTRRAH
jgi:membrane-bound lytic murein transglycosylase D